MLLHVKDICEVVLKQWPSFMNVAVTVALIHAVLCSLFHEFKSCLSAVELTGTICMWGNVMPGLLWHNKPSWPPLTKCNWQWERWVLFDAIEETVFFFFSLDPSHILSNTDFMCSFCLNQSGYIIHTVCIECVFLFTTILSPHMRFSSSLFVALIIHTWHNWGQNVFCHSNNTQREILCFFSTTFIWLSYFQILFSNTICNIINEITYRVVHKLPIWMWWHA